MTAPRAILFAAISPKIDRDRTRLQQALEEIARIDASLVRTDPASGDAVVRAQSEQHLEAIRAVLLADYQIETLIGDPQVIYLETIRRHSEAQGKYIRQTGGAGNYGHVKLRLEPSDPGSGLTFVNEIRGGVIPEQYLPAIEQGIRQAALGGVLAGCEVVDCKAILDDGSYHQVDSNVMAFRIAASQAFKEAARKASPVLMEPWMTLQVTVPEEHIRTIFRDLSARRGRIETLDRSSEWPVVHAFVPLAKMFGYARNLGQWTQGRASHTMDFARYEPTRFPFGSEDEAGAVVMNPRGPRPRSDGAVADPDWD